MFKKLLFTLFFVQATVYLIAQPPANYYNNAAGKSCSQLKTALKTIITNGHADQGYNALWNQYSISDLKPREVGSGSSMVIWDPYSDNPIGPDPYNFTPGTGTGGQQDQGSGGGSEGQFYNREHSVPLSWHSSSTSSISGTDYHHVFPTDKKVNATRANFIYGEVGSTVSYTCANASASYSGGKLGTSNFTGLTGTVFEPIDSFKGDLARAFLYFVTRYEDDIPGWSSNAEAAQAFDNNTFPSVKIPYLKLMLKWHNLDPVSLKEINRNNAAYTYQGNRNPYVDNPAYVGLAWNASCPGLSTLPVNLIVFGGRIQNNNVELQWEVGSEIDFSHYEIERSMDAVRFEKAGTVHASGRSKYSFTETARNFTGKTVYYRLKKVDKDGRYTYSDVITLRIPLNIQFSVYPNPATNFVKLQLHNVVTEPIKVMIADRAGHLISTQSYTANAGLISIPVYQLTNGTYFIKAIVNGEAFTEKLVVLK